MADRTRPDPATQAYEGAQALKLEAVASGREKEIGNDKFAVNAITVTDTTVNAVSVGGT